MPEIAATLIDHRQLLIGSGLLAGCIVAMLVWRVYTRWRRTRPSPYNLMQVSAQRQLAPFRIQPQAQRSTNQIYELVLATQTPTAAALAHKQASDMEPAAEAPRLTRVTYTNLTARQRRAVHRQAQLDYKQARGTAHRTLLEASRQRLEGDLRQVETEIQRLREQMQSLETQHQAELRAALELYLVRHRFDEVPGIGSALKARILAATNARTLADLYRADTVPGVGEGRMAAIAAWIEQTRHQMPALLAQPFPGRDPIDQRFYQQKSDLQNTLSQRQAQAEVLRQRMTVLDQHLDALKAVTPQTFQEAASGHQEAQRAAMQYTIGLFAEWEPVPTWFQEIVERKTG